LYMQGGKCGREFTKRKRKRAVDDFEWQFCWLIKTAPHYRTTNEKILQKSGQLVYRVIKGRSEDEINEVGRKGSDRLVESAPKFKLLERTRKGGRRVVEIRPKKKRAGETQVAIDRLVKNIWAY